MADRTALDQARGELRVLLQQLNDPNNTPADRAMYRTRVRDKQREIQDLRRDYERRRRQERAAVAPPPAAPPTGPLAIIPPAAPPPGGRPPRRPGRVAGWWGGQSEPSRSSIIVIFVIIAFFVGLFFTSTVFNLNWSLTYIFYFWLVVLFLFFLWKFRGEVFRDSYKRAIRGGKNRWEAATTAINSRLENAKSSLVRVNWGRYAVYITIVIFFLGFLALVNSALPSLSWILFLVVLGAVVFAVWQFSRGNRRNSYISGGVIVIVIILAIVLIFIYNISWLALLLPSSLFLPLIALVFILLAINRIRTNRSFDAGSGGLLFIALIFVFFSVRLTGSAFLQTAWGVTPVWGLFVLVNMSGVIALFWYSMHRLFRDKSGLPTLAARQRDIDTGLTFLGLSVILLVAMIIYWIYDIGAYFLTLMLGGAGILVYKIWTIDRDPEDRGISTIKFKWWKVVATIGVFLGVSAVAMVYGFITPLLQMEGVALPVIGALLTQPLWVLGFVLFVVWLIEVYFVYKKKKWTTEKKVWWITIPAFVGILLIAALNYFSAFYSIVGILTPIGSILIILSLLGIYYTLRHLETKNISSKFWIILVLVLIPVLFIGSQMWLGGAAIVSINPYVLIGAGVVIFLGIMFYVAVKIPAKDENGKPILGNIKKRRLILYGSAFLIAGVLIYFYVLQLGAFAAVFAELTAGSGRFVVGIGLFLLGVPFLFIKESRLRFLTYILWILAILYIWLGPSIFYFVSQQLPALPQVRWIVFGIFGLIGLYLVFKTDAQGRHSSALLGFIFILLAIGSLFLIPFLSSEIAQKYTVEGEIILEELNLMERLERLWEYVKNPEAYFSKYGQFDNPDVVQRGPRRGIQIVAFEPVLSSFRGDQKVKLQAELNHFSIPSFRENEEDRSRVDFVDLEFSCFGFNELTKSKPGKIRIAGSCGGAKVENNKIKNVPRYSNCTGLFVFCEFEENDFNVVATGKNRETKKATFQIKYSNFVTESRLRTYTMGKKRYDNIFQQENWELELLQELRGAASYPGLVSNERKVTSEYTGGPVQLSVSLLNQQPIYPGEEDLFLHIQSVPDSIEWEGNVFPKKLSLITPQWFEPQLVEKENGCSFVPDSDQSLKLNDKELEILRGCNSAQGCLFYCEFGVSDSGISQNVEEYFIKAYQTSDYILNKSASFDIIDLKKIAKKDDETLCGSTKGVWDEVTKKCKCPDGKVWVGDVGCKEEAPAVPVSSTEPEEPEDGEEEGDEQDDNKELCETTEGVWDEDIEECDCLDENKIWEDGAGCVETPTEE